MAEQVTAKQVMDAMIAADIDWVDSHECAICFRKVGYARRGDRLFFQPECSCSFSPEEPRTWQDAADWINMQTSDEARLRIAARFGLK